jgi:hypothetical protein
MLRLPLAVELAEEKLKEQESLPKSDESNASEDPLPEIVSIEDRVSSSASTELELGPDGRPFTSRKEVSSPSIPTNPTKPPK